MAIKAIIEWNGTSFPDERVAIAVITPTTLYDNMGMGYGIGFSPCMKHWALTRNKFSEEYGPGLVAYGRYVRPAAKVVWLSSPHTDMVWDWARTEKEILENDRSTFTVVYHQRIKAIDATGKHIELQASYYLEEV